MDNQKVNIFGNRHSFQDKSAIGVPSYSHFNEVRTYYLRLMTQLLRETYQSIETYTETVMLPNPTTMIKF